VHIDATLGGDVQQRFGKDLAEGYYYNQIGFQLQDGFNKGWIANFMGLQNREAMT
jgi:hypothetical protein